MSGNEHLVPFRFRCRETVLKREKFPNMSFDNTNNLSTPATFTGCLSRERN